MLIRLHKYLADRGVASRRKCEEYIQKGLVKVNGRVETKLGIKIDPEKDKIETHADLHQREQKFVYYALNKPVGYVCSVSGPEQPKITELLQNIPERVFPVGRLDKLTSGLILITNDGRFAYEVTHPKFEKEKEYIAKVREKLLPPELEEMRRAMLIRGRRTIGAEVILQAPHVMRVIIREGRNRQIRRLAMRAGLHIEKLKRVRIGLLSLGGLASGQLRKLRHEEIASLRSQ